MIASEAIPSDWIRHLRGGRLGIGYDVATTEKKTSNPSSITVTESQGGKYWQRLVVRFKTADPEAAMVALETILASAPARSLESLCVDASNERYHAQNVKKRMRKHLPVHLIVSGETIVWEGEKFSYKTLLGQLYVSAFEDQRMSLPGGEWLIKDHRLVKNHAGGFATDLDDEGNHGDTFDSGKLALWSHLRGGKHDARGISAMQVGGSGGKSVRDDRLVTLARRQLRFGVPGEARNNLSS
jgi:hypothetical protein